MPESSELVPNFSSDANRRIHARHRIRSLAYVELGENNGGIVLNIGEGGFAVRAAEAITEDSLPQVRFQTHTSANQLIASGEIVWTGNSRKEAGVRFVDLPAEALGEIKTWISEEESPVNFKKPMMAVARQTARTNTSLSDRAEETTEAGEGTEISEPRVAGNHLSKSSILRQTKNESWISRQPAVSGKPPITWMDFRIQIGAGWALVAFVILLVAISFAAGMAIRRGDLIGFSGGLRDQASQNNVEIQSATPNAAPPGAASKVSNIDIVDSSNRRWTIPAKSPVVHANQDAEGSSPAQNIGTEPLSAPHGAPPNVTGSTFAPAKKSPVLLSLPETSLGASDSVAISSQRSLSVPTDSSPGKNLHVGQLVNLVEPVYPPDAQKNHVEGTVKLRATIGTDGAIKDLQTLSGPPSLLPAALSAVREWRYDPTLLNGQPIETQENISLVFRLPK
ncbi:MAG: TonB family protein [Candidatus Acidiferrales bacterium]